MHWTAKKEPRKLHEANRVHLKLHEAEKVISNYAKLKKVHKKAEVQILYLPDLFTTA